jgi:hypothetical protein
MMLLLYNIEQPVACQTYICGHTLNFCFPIRMKDNFLSGLVNVVCVGKFIKQY